MPQKINRNLYLPTPVKVIKIKNLSPNVKLFRLEKAKGWFPKNENELIFNPGQFFMAGLWGFGEAPFGGASDPYEEKYIEIAVRKVGNVTNSFHRLKINDEMTLRGPFGHGYPLEFFENRDVIMITGGCGLPPIAALIEYIIKNRKKFNKVYLLYGAATPNDLLFKNKFREWKKSIEIILTVDKSTPDWKGKVGWVSSLVNEIDIEPLNAVAAMCGPGPMVGAMEKVLKPLGISNRRTFVADERKMQCATGKCQHCVTGEKYVCLEGPVFYLDQIDKNWD